MLALHGVGQAKLDRYGNAFLACLAAHDRAETGVADAKAESALI